MKSYRFYRLGADYRIIAPPEDHECGDDLDALDRAKQLANGHAIDVWLGTRFVARVKPGDAPLTVDDPKSLYTSAASPEGQ
jgi:hypothetical protein